MNKTYLAAAAASLLAFVIPCAAQAAPVTITVNGNALSFDQPPIERGGRVYVPLRGVFERLGATVVYARPTINATGNGHNINLSIGSRSATVDGNGVSLDSPPFLVGSRTLVPLRFVAQALGATVNYNGNTRVVAISGSGGGNSSGSASGNSGNANGNVGTVSLTNLNPNNGDVISSKAPTLTGNFSENVDANSVHILLDTRDITSSSSAYVSPNSFQITLPQIPAQQHTVTVRGNSAAGAAFSQSYSFTSGADTSKPFVQNVRINGVAATQGMQVPASYTVAGSATPNSTVQVIIGYSTSILNGLIPTGDRTNSQTVTADGSGRFSANIDSSLIGSPAQYSLALRSINTTTKASSTPVQFSVHT
ncbi:MAG: copper amine oxidase N-terminal domain-containing protein [Candidatus Eremiobacteraeota bacterium]|nr:copper amine oxidase N-terminal domain-containing protein [Candidatus Eremiobacteraeota bacterium]